MLKIRRGGVSRKVSKNFAIKSLQRISICGNPHKKRACRVEKEVPFDGGTAMTSSENTGLAQATRQFHKLVYLDK